jgi:hypothetical protein
MTESHHSTAAEELDLPIPDWEVEDDALWQIRLASDDAFRLALSRHFGHQLIRGKVILAARDKDLTTR